MTTKIKPIPKRIKPQPKTKEQFLIEWVLLRAAFRDEFNGVAAVRAASDAWNEIQRLK